jgi:hypothetical protein
VHSLPEGGALEGSSLRVFPNLRRTHKYENLSLPYLNNSLLISSLLLSWLVEKEYFHGNMKTYKIG